LAQSTQDCTRTNHRHPRQRHFADPLLMTQRSVSEMPSPHQMVRSSTYTCVFMRDLRGWLLKRVAIFLIALLLTTSLLTALPSLADSAPPSVANPNHVLSISTKLTRVLGFSLSEAPASNWVGISPAGVMQHEEKLFPSARLPKTYRVFLLTETSFSHDLAKPYNAPVLCWGVVVLAKYPGLHSVVNDTRGQNWTLVMIDAKTLSLRLAVTGKSVLHHN